MDNLKSLMDKKQYALVLKITENSEDANDLFYRVSAFLATSALDKALETIEKYQKTLETNLSILIKIHIEILCLMNRFDDAYDKLKYYENLPYVSQQVEEILREMPSFIRGEEKRCYASIHYSDAQLGKMLTSKESEQVLIGLDSIRERDLTPFYNLIENIMVNFPKQSIRSFALLLLVQKKIDKFFSFKHIDKVVKVNPKELTPPFIGDEFNEVVRNININFNNPSLSDNAVQILSSYLIYIYPQYIEYQDDNLIEALYEVSCDYLHVDRESSLEERCFDKNLSLEKVQYFIAEINKALEDF